MVKCVVCMVCVCVCGGSSSLARVLINRHIEINGVRNGKKEFVRLVNW